MQGTGEGIPVRDKRGTGQGQTAPGPTAGAPETSAAEAPAAPQQPETEIQEGAALQEQPAAISYLDDLRRVQAEFANYRKRVMRDQAAAASRASARLIERLLPVLDNFELALAHGEGTEADAGIGLVYKQLKEALADEGLEEIPAHDVAFDPTVHEAVEARESADVDQPTSVSVYRKGYRLKGQVVRPAMVVVARPIEPSEAPLEPVEVQDDSIPSAVEGKAE